MEKIRQFLDPKDLRRLKLVCQSGGSNPQVKWEAEGFEAMLFASITFGGLPLTKKGVINVFDDHDKWLGIIKKGEYDLPERYAADEDLTFADFYQERG